MFGAFISLNIFVGERCWANFKEDFYKVEELQRNKQRNCCCCMDRQNNNNNNNNKSINK